MSYGYSISDGVLLVQLAWNAVQNSRRACGEYHELTQQVTGLHLVLRRLRRELQKGKWKEKEGNGSHHSSDTFEEELRIIVNGCVNVLETLNKILKKYNSLGGDEAEKYKRMWQKVRFGNGEVVDLGDLRSKVTYYTSLLTLFLNLRSSGSIGRIEQQMNNAGGDLKEIKSIVNGIAALQISQGNHEGSVLSSYTNDDKHAWKDVRRELRDKHGFRDHDLRRYKKLIVKYIAQLGDRGAFDDNVEKASRSSDNSSDAGANDEEGEVLSPRLAEEGSEATANVMEPVVEAGGSTSERNQDYQDTRGQTLDCANTNDGQFAPSTACVNCSYDTDANTKHKDIIEQGPQAPAREEGKWMEIPKSNLDVQPEFSVPTEIQVPATPEDSAKFNFICTLYELDIEPHGQSFIRDSPHDRASRAAKFNELIEIIQWDIVIPTWRLNWYYRSSDKASPKAFRKRANETIAALKDEVVKGAPWRLLWLRNRYYFKIASTWICFASTLNHSDPSSAEVSYRRKHIQEVVKDLQAIEINTSWLQAFKNLESTKNNLLQDLRNML
ncbi:hypothetical protein ACLMJK_003936 [Lecanora helva]